MVLERDTVELHSLGEGLAKIEVHVVVPVRGLGVHVVLAIGGGAGPGAPADRASSRAEVGLVSRVRPPVVASFEAARVLDNVCDYQYAKLGFMW